MSVREDRNSRQSDGYLGALRMKWRVVICLYISLASFVLSGAESEVLPFYKGGDISMITRFEKEGLVLKEKGKPVDLFKVMMRHGCNTFWVRLFVNPNGKGGVIQDLDYVIALGKRMKGERALFMLDFHYSDTWADPGHQHVPAAWKDLSFDGLEKKVEVYTRDVLQKCKKAGCSPDLVQIGNEIQTGIMKPFGEYRKDGGGWGPYGRLLNAGVRGARGSGVPAKIIIHSHAGGKTGKCCLRWGRFGRSRYSSDGSDRSDWRV